jgi:hypothetical protein
LSTYEEEKVETAEVTYIPNELRKLDVAILVVDSFTCYCSACGQEAMPNETNHKIVAISGLVVANAYPEEVGCGAKFIATTSPYEGIHARQGAKRLRPDLPFIDAHIER